MRDASDFGRGRANGCVRIALQLFVRCVYALVSPPPHWVRLRRLRRDASEAWVRDASDFGRGRAYGCVRIALQLFVRCVYALVSRLRTWCV